MSREKDEGKRRAILLEAKRLFASRGFHGTSVSDIVRGIGLPVGSVYTYFSNKEEILSCIIEEGWGEFRDQLIQGLAQKESPEAKLGLVVGVYLPALFRDTELISIIIAEGGREAGLDKKLESLSEIVASIVEGVARSRGSTMSFPPNIAKPALMVFFLGSLDAVRLSRNAGLSVSEADIISFIYFLAESSLGVKLDPPLGLTRL